MIDIYEKCRTLTVSNKLADSNNWQENFDENCYEIKYDET